MNTQVDKPTKPSVITLTHIGWPTPEGTLGLQVSTSIEALLPTRYCNVESSYLAAGHANSSFMSALSSMIDVAIARVRQLDLPGTILIDYGSIESHHVKGFRYRISRDSKAFVARFLKRDIRNRGITVDYNETCTEIQVYRTLKVVK